MRRFDLWSLFVWFFSPTLFCLIKISMRAITNLLSWFYFRLLSLLSLPCHVQTVNPMPSFKIGYRVLLNMLLHHPCDAIKVHLVVIHHSLFKFSLKLSEQHYHINHVLVCLSNSITLQSLYGYVGFMFAIYLIA